MAAGKKTGGRKKGTPNETTEQTREWAAKLKAKYDVDSFVAKAMASGDLKLQGFVWKVLTEYERGKPVQPVSGADGGAVPVTLINHVARPQRGGNGANGRNGAHD